MTARKSKPECTWSVRLAMMADAAQIAALHTASRNTAYADLVEAEVLHAPANREADWAERLAQAQSQGNEIFVAQDGEHIVGFAFLKPERLTASGADAAEVDRIYIDPNCWGKGIGKSLFQSCLASCQKHRYKSLFLWTFKSNLRARRFYESLGFVAQDITRKSGRYPEEIQYMLEVARR